MSFVARLRDRVDAQPEAVAIACAGEPALTYRALWDRASAIAGTLVADGAQPGDIVMLELEKSPELVASMIGCWLARAAFVPVLPEIPAGRRQQVLDETAARFAIRGSASQPTLERLVHDSVDRLRRSLPDGSGRLDGAASSRGPAVPGFSPDDLAYVIYTSGSTGQPKGVAVSHRGIVDLLDAQIAAFDLCTGDRCLWVLSPSFDASISDIGTALLAGATLLIEHPDRSRTPSGIATLLHARRVTHVDLPPSMLPLLPDPPRSLRTIVIGGEVCSPAAVRAWASRVRLVNVYGPTEATVCSTLCVCSPTWDRPLLGEPLTGVRLHVEPSGPDTEASRRTRASRSEPQASRPETGELWIGGPAVADGYLQQPELTVARFVERDGTRWFRTGDRVSRLAGGELEFLGRIDRQLKVAGVLVAPEEVEARLREHPAVAEAVVALERRGGRDLLVAYCVPTPDGVGQLETAARVFGDPRFPTLVDAAQTRPPVTTRELRRHLGTVLDRRLIPRRVFLVDALPRLANGKLDASDLRVSTEGRHALDATVFTTAAANRAVRRLAEVWGRVLEIDAEQLVDDDDFFDLGGDSFAVVELIALGELAGFALGVEDVYRHRTLAALAGGGRRLDTARAPAWSGDRGPASGDPDVGTGVFSRIGGASCAELVADIDPDLDRLQTTSTPRCVDRDHVGATLGAGAEVGAGAVLLTGATGLLGRRVLENFLARSTRPVICLVRASDDVAARERVTRAIGATGQRGLGRVTCLAGDITATRFGLGEPIWRELAEQVDTIVHCAAELSLGRPYGELRAANVGAVATVVELASTGKRKTIHHASTLSVFVGSDRASMSGRQVRDALQTPKRSPGEALAETDALQTPKRSPGEVLAETDALEGAERLHGGYAESKWAAEYLLRETAGALGLDVAVYRFGLLVDEHAPAGDREWLASFVRGLADLGRYPRVDQVDWSVDVTPVGFASAAMVELALGASRTSGAIPVRERGAPASPRVFHIANRCAATLEDVVTALAKAGVALEAVSLERWRALADDISRSSPGAEISAAVLGLCRVDDSYERIREYDIFQASGVTFSMTNTRAALGDRVAWPARSAELLDRYVAAVLGARR